MTLFWILAGGLVLLVLAMLAVPLLRGSREGADAARQREQNIAIARERLAELRAAHAAGELSDEAFEQARAELEIEVLEDAGEEPRRKIREGGGWLLPVLVLLLPALAIGLYFDLGSPEALRGAGRQSPPATAENGAHSLEEMVAKLAERMRAQPDDARGWLLLGRSYMTLERYPEAVEAFRRARRLVGDVPAVLVPLADALAMTQGGELAGEPFELLKKAHDADPGDPTTLWLLGMAWMQQGRPGQALEYWYALRPQLAEDPENASRLALLIERAEKQLKAEGKPLPSAAGEKAGGVSVASDRTAVTVHVELDPALREAVPPQAVLFVYAKVWKGPPMPLAVVRRKVSELPLDVRLDDSLAMMPAMRISKFDALRIEARVSKSGNALAQPGDLIGTVGPVKPGSRVKVTIDQRVGDASGADRSGSSFPSTSR